MRPPSAGTLGPLAVDPRASWTGATGRRSWGVAWGLEWWEGLRFFPPQALFESAFFTLIGLHAFHVLTGVVALTIVQGLGKRGRFGSQDYWALEGVVKYWHFVDVAWVFILPTLYLVS